MRLMPALLLLAITHAPAIAQEVPSCTQSAYRQFDFWVGEWDVVDTRGQPAGVNRIEKTLNGCALHETWTSAGLARGIGRAARRAARRGAAAREPADDPDQRPLTDS